MAKKRTVRRRKKTAPTSVGLAAADTRSVDASATASIERQVEADGGVVLDRAVIEAKISELVGRYMASRDEAEQAMRKNHE